PVLRVEFVNVGLSLAGGAATVTNGNGFVLLSGAGLVGSVSAHLGVSSGVTFGADLNITINTTTMPVNESITPESGPPLTINVPAGPYLKIDGNTALTIAGQSI